MKRNKKILVACDLSDHSGKLLEYAAELSESMKIPLIIVNVINQKDIHALQQAIHKEDLMNSGISIEDYLKDLKEERLRSIQKIIKESSYPYINPKKIIRIGIPFEAISQTAIEEGADLVVMGTSGRTQTSGVLLGSTAEKMFRYCPVSLLSVRINS